MKRYILFFVILVFFAVGSLNATTLFNSFGLGDSYNINIGLTVGWNPFYDDAITGNQFSFGGTVPYKFDMVELAMSHVLGANELDLRLMSDVGNQPGAIMETFHFSGAMNPLGQYNPLLVAHSTGWTVLYPNTNYWFVASVPLGSSAAWNISSPAVSGTFAQMYGSGPWNVNQGTMSAFRVTGAVVPEPSTFLLLGTGFLGLGFYRWKKRKK